MQDCAAKREADWRMAATSAFDSEVDRPRPALRDRVLGSGRVVVSEIESPILSVNLVEKGRAVVQSYNATEPDRVNTR